MELYNMFEVQDFVVMPKAVARELLAEVRVLELEAYIHGRSAGQTEASVSKGVDDADTFEDGYDAGYDCGYEDGRMYERHITDQEATADYREGYADGLADASRGTTRAA